MTHQERVAKAAIEYKDAKKLAKVRAKAEAKAVYLQVYSQKKAEAYAAYSAALMKSASDEIVNVQNASIPQAKRDYSIDGLRVMNVEDIVATMEPEEGDEAEDLSKFPYVELMELYQTGKITAEQAQAALK